MIVKSQPYEPDLPNHNDLPDSDGAIVENALDLPQRSMLTESLRPWLEKLRPDGQFFIGSEQGIYWRLTDPPLDGCKSPDWYYVPGVPPLLDRKSRRSYVMWQELVPPLIVIEAVSRDGSEEHDATPLTGKFWVYEQAIKPEYYLIYDVENGGKIEAYRLVDGKYRPLEANSRGHFAVPPLELEFGLWDGSHFGYEAPWLRAFDSDGSMLPVPEEVAEEQRLRAEKAELRAEKADLRAEEERRRASAAIQQVEEERLRAEQADRRAEEERLRAERLAARLRELGLDPNDQ